MAEAVYKIAHDIYGNTVAVGNNGLVLYSTDGGGTWTRVNIGVGNDLYGIAWGEVYGLPSWVLVGENGLIMHSVDMLTWTTAPVITTEHLYGVVFAGGFIAVGANGTLIYSPTLGESWQLKSSGTTEDLLSISFNLGIYTIVGTNDTIIVGQLSTLEKEAAIKMRTFRLFKP